MIFAHLRIGECFFMRFDNLLHFCVKVGPEYLKAIDRRGEPYIIRVSLLRDDPVKPVLH